MREEAVRPHRLCNAKARTVRSCRKHEIVDMCQTDMCEGKNGLLRQAWFRSILVIVTAITTFDSQNVELFRALRLGPIGSYTKATLG